MPDSMPPRLLAACERAYRLLLRLYPAAHRSEYGAPMAQAFRDLAREAYLRGGSWALCRLWLWVLADMARSAAKEQLAWLGGSGAPVTPASWPRVAMAVVPGVTALVTFWAGSRLRLSDLLGPAVMRGSGATVSYEELGLLLTLLLSGALFLRERRLPACGLTVLGILLGLCVAGPLTLLWVPIGLAVAAGPLRRRGRAVRCPGRAWAILALLTALSLWPRPAFGLGWGLLGVAGTLVVVALGLPLARRHGLSASLLVVASGFALWEGTFDLTYGLGGTFWGDTMWTILAACLLVVSPLWVLRARSSRRQAWGLLVPTLVALAAVVTINAVVRTDPGLIKRLLNGRALVHDVPFAYGISVGSLGPAQLLPLLLRDGVTVAQLFLALLLAVVLYPWAERQGRPTDAIGDDACATPTT